MNVLGGGLFLSPICSKLLQSTSSLRQLWWATSPSWNRRNFRKETVGLKVNQRCISQFVLIWCDMLIYLYSLYHIIYINMCVCVFCSSCCFWCWEAIVCDVHFKTIMTHWKTPCTDYYIVSHCWQDFIHARWCEVDSPACFADFSSAVQLKRLTTLTTWT